MESFNYPWYEGRIICELERIYGVKHGGDRNSKMNNVQLATQEELAQKIKCYNVEFKKQ